MREWVYAIEITTSNAQTGYLDVIQYDDLAFEVEVGFEDKNLAFYPSIDEDLVTFGESLKGMLKKDLDHIWNINCIVCGGPQFEHSTSLYNTRLKMRTSNRNIILK